MIFGKNMFINPGVGVKDFSIHYSRDIIDDLTPIVSFALDTCIFRACNHTNKQIRRDWIPAAPRPNHSN